MKGEDRNEKRPIGRRVKGNELATEPIHLTRAIRSGNTGEGKGCRFGRFVYRVVE